MRTNIVVNRREFSRTIAGAVALPALTARAETAWGAPVVDCHHHLRPATALAANAAHLDGCGISNALVLAPADSAGTMKALTEKYPGRFVGWFASVDVARPDAARILTEAVKRRGAIGFGELKSHGEAAGREFQRVFAAAGELGVPILVHFQEVPHTPAESVFATGFARFEAMLKKYPRTRFIGHADAFWANISADYANQEAYPSGPVKRNGITDKLLGDYPNLFGDLSANSGNNALSRDAEFTVDFLTRHQDKLIFGSDCMCADGKGAGISQGNNPAARRMIGKCVARETLTVLKRSASPEAFRKMAWGNAHRVYRLGGA
jgi:uncharacterized protein